MDLPDGPHRLGQDGSRHRAGRAPTTASSSASIPRWFTGAWISAAPNPITPHHLVDIRDPAEPYSVAEFCEDARAAILDILARQRIPLLVGGTMLYFKALLEGIADMPAADPEVRGAPGVGSPEPRAGRTCTGCWRRSTRNWRRQYPPQSFPAYRPRPGGVPVLRRHDERVAPPPGGPRWRWLLTDAYRVCQLAICPASAPNCMPASSAALDP